MTHSAYPLLAEHSDADADDADACACANAGAIFLASYDSLALTLLLAEPPLLDFLLICLDFSLILYAFFLASYDSLSLTPLLAEPPVFLTAQPAAAPLGLSKHPSPPPPDTFAPTFLSCIYFSFSSLNCLVCFSACDKFDRQI